jgi:TnpA family transposase
MGPSLPAFGFTYLLGYRLLPRLKNIGAADLNRPFDGASCAGLETVLTRPIRWELIHQQYDQMIKYARALQLGTAEAEQILRRFNTKGPKHPTLQAIEELGRAIKTAFVADYQADEQLRQEVHSGGVSSYTFTACSTDRNTMHSMYIVDSSGAGRSW